VGTRRRQVARAQFAQAVVEDRLAAAMPRLGDLLEDGHAREPSDKTHLAGAIGIRACSLDSGSRLATATEWVAKLCEAKRSGSLEAELLGSACPLIGVEAVGYTPFESDAQPDVPPRR
jgi:hypothetical protein